MRKILFLTLLLFPTIHLLSQQITITGSSTVNHGETQTYYASFDYNVHPYAILLWSVSGGTITSQSTNQNSNSVWCTIEWDNGSAPIQGNVSLYEDLNGISGELEVQVGEQTCISANAGPDKTICPGASTIIGTPGIAGYSYSWYPGNSLNNPNIAQPTATPLFPTTDYTLIMTGLDNLLTNSDFESGLTGFQTDYGTYPNGVGCSGGVWGSIAITSNPESLGQQYCNHPDHSSNGDKMLFVDGSCTPNLRIWSQTVNVAPNTVYHFSGFASSASFRSGYYTPTDAGRLKIKVNGVIVLQNWLGTDACETWKEFTFTWNSDNQTSATIEFFNDNLITDLNDFCLDDLYFGLCPRTMDVVRVLHSSTTSLSITPVGTKVVCTPWEFTPTNSTLLTSSASISGQYQWYKDGVIIPNANAQTYDAKVNQQGNTVRIHNFSVADPIAGCNSNSKTVYFVPTPLTPEGYSGVRNQWFTVESVVSQIPGTIYTWNIPGATIVDNNINDPSVNVFFPSNAPSQVNGTVTISQSSDCLNGIWPCTFYLIGGRNVSIDNDSFNNLTDKPKTLNTVFPNPATSQITIKSSEPIYEIELLDINRTVSYIRKKNRESISVIIDVSSLKPGIYLCKVISKTKTEFIKVHIIR